MRKVREEHLKNEAEIPHALTYSLGELLSLEMEAPLRFTQVIEHSSLDCICPEQKVHFI